MKQSRTSFAAGLAALLLSSCAGPGGNFNQTAVAGQPPVAVTDARDAAQNDSGQEVVVTGTRAKSESDAIVVTSNRISGRSRNAPSVNLAMAPPPMAMAVAPNTRFEPRPSYYHDEGRDKFTAVAENTFKAVSEEPVSTFSLDVDTASYAFVRASLDRNVLPQPDAVRTEEMINYFPYDYAAPKSAEQPFTTAVNVFPSPWTAGRKLVRIGVRGYDLQRTTRPRANLVFLIDTSGSMNEPNKLPLVKQSLAMLLGQLGPEDRVSIVTYAGYAGTALEPTPASEKGKILAVIDGLGAGGSTAGAEGIRQAYALAERSLDPAGVNRVILATDGDFNVGITDQNEL